MLIGNFRFMENSDIPEEICYSCQDAENNYIIGSYRGCALMCRAAVEAITKWIFDKEVFFERPCWYDKRMTTLVDCLKSRELRDVIGDHFLMTRVDMLRDAGNDAAHKGMKTITREDALDSLKMLHEYVTALYSRYMDEPCRDPFFEPYDDSNYEEPLERDYPALIAGETDPEMRARWALLHKCENRHFDITPFADALEPDSLMLRLIRAITSSQVLDVILAENTIQLKQLVLGCYAGFDRREIQAVIGMCIRACRRLVAAYYKTIQKNMECAV